MFFIRSLPFLASVIVSVGLWSLGTSLVPVEGAYVALLCSDAIPDREIVGRLESNGFSGLVSESGQRVLLDCFEKVEQIPLDEYSGRLLPFDPRNDRYAEKLRSLFIQDEKRIIYIPGNYAKPAYEKRIDSVLSDIPHSLVYGRRGDSAYFFLILYGLAVITLFVFRPPRLALRPDLVCLLSCLPVLAPLALSGAAGFAQASLLAGCAALLAGPCSQRLAFRRRSRSFQRLFQAALRPPVMQQQQSLPMPYMLPLVMLICYGVIAFLSGFPVIFPALAFALFCGVFAFSLWAASFGELSAAAARSTGFAGLPGGLFPRLQNPGRRRFSPIPIMRRRSLNYAFAWAMLPFAVIALVLVFLFVPPSAPADRSWLPPADTVTEEDYYSHIFFQSTFSLRPLHEAGYFQADRQLYSDIFIIDPDGLPGQIGGIEPFLLEDIPPFPLGDLIRYLDAADTVRLDFTMPGLLSALLPLLFIVFALIQQTIIRTNAFTFDHMYYYELIRLGGAGRR
jgi:hypothetical protein